VRHWEWSDVSTVTEWRRGPAATASLALLVSALVHHVGWVAIPGPMAVLIITLGARAIQPSRRRTLTTPATAAP